MSEKFNEHSWKKCSTCFPPMVFKTPSEFLRHLREYHCSQEGGSFVCKYGYNDVCTTLPGIGVSDEDYENHIKKHHVFRSDLTVSTSSKMSPNSNDQPNVVSDRGKWTVYNSTQNLPAVLNDPIRGKQKDFFTKTWGDTFVEKTHIPRSPFLVEITKAHFESYLKKTSRRYKRHIKQSSFVLKSATTHGDESTQTLPLLQSSKHLVAEKNHIDLQNIPKIFSMPQFDLENPEIFNCVFPWHHLYPPKDKAVGKDGTKEQSSSKLLQEKLSHYLDVVEVQIAHQISMKSAAFFSVMSSHDALMEQLSQKVLAVKQLRQKIQHIDDVFVRGSLRILSLARTRQNYIAVYNKLKLMATVHQTQPTIQLLLTNSEFVGALDLIFTTREILSQELAGIHSFRHLGSQLAEMEKLIDTMMQTDFVRYITTDLNRPLTDVKMIMEEDRLIAIVFGMMHQRCYNFIDIFEDETFTAMKTVVKQTVIEVISQEDFYENEGCFVSILDWVKQLGLSQWVALLNEVFSNVLKLLNRIKAVYGVISDAVDIAGGKALSHHSAILFNPLHDTPEVTNISVAFDEDAGVNISEADHAKLRNNLKELLVAVCNHAHDRCAKLFSTKAKDGFIEKLSSSEFVHVSKLIEEFISKCEAICGRKSTSLMLGLQSQANRFVNRFHEEKKTKLSLILDSERWKQADVPSEFQELVDNISSTNLLVIPKKSLEAESVEEKKPQEFLIVDGEKYAVVGTVLLLLKMIVEYCQCVSDIPSVSFDLLTRLEEIMKLFNSRTCQLILGAGALQLVGLKTITTKNLALASRCLQLIAYYIPLVKQHFEQYLPAKHSTLGKHFDQVLKDYTDHIQEIENKLVAIIESMFDSQLEKWEVKPPVPSSYFRAICKHIAKLHEAIADLLPDDQIQLLFLRINVCFKEKLKIQLQNLHVNNDGGPQHGLVTSELAFYTQNLLSLHCFGNDVDLVMDDIWVNR